MKSAPREDLAYVTRFRSYRGCSQRASQISGSNLLAVSWSLTMPITTHSNKRKRAQDDEIYEDDDVSEGSSASSDEDVDIFSALTGKRSKRKAGAKVSEDVDLEDLEMVQDDEDLEDVIQDSITKRNVKSGTELVKKAKGNA